jgi:hypothetical protein
MPAKFSNYIKIFLHVIPTVPTVFTGRTLTAAGKVIIIATHNTYNSDGDIPNDLSSVEPTQ